MIQLDTFHPSARTALVFPDEMLRELPCGLVSCPLAEAEEALPELAALYATVPVRHPDQWIIDVKIHMLMPGAYPCVPNWHCDFVPRDDTGTRYDLAGREPLMFLWVSGGPETEYLRNPPALTVDSHADLSALAGVDAPTPIEAQRWYQFSQLSPHRGTPAREHCWRVFARLTHTMLDPPKPTVSVIRRHAQVYLDAAAFTW